MKRLLRQILALLPEKIPTGVTSFNVWVDSFFDIYDMPTNHKDSVKFVLAHVIMATDASKSPFKAVYRSKFYYYLMLNSHAAKQVAGEAFHSIKLAQKAEEERLKNAAKTVLTSEAPDNVRPLTTA